jgi:putative copper resistance protein D
VDEPLILTRAIHFAATLTAAGVVFFLLAVAEPAFAKAGQPAAFVTPLRRNLAFIAWGGLVLAIASGVAWLVILAQRISDATLTAVFRDGIVWILLTRSDFGKVWAVRLGLAVVLGLFLALAAGRRTPRPGATLVFAVALAGSLAFAGHAGAGEGTEGTVHLAADMLHLVATAAWVGALVPLALLLFHAANDGGFTAVAREATRRFSIMGMASVGTILATGIVNTYVLAGSIPALLGTQYGRLVLLKVSLFLVMVSVAAINRQLLTPRLMQEEDARAARLALRRIRTNSLIEAAVGAMILVVVAILGTLPPGLQE